MMKAQADEKSQAEVIERLAELEGQLARTLRLEDLERANQKLMEGLDSIQARLES